MLLPSAGVSSGRLALLLLAAASLGFAPVPFVVRPVKKTPEMAARESLLGHWHNPASPSVVVDITPTELAYINSGVRNNVYRMTLDVTKVPFKYDCRKPGANFVGLWKIEGDKLTLYYNGERAGVADGGRPTSFTAGGMAEVYYRVKARK
jgi:hypothetical protein